MVKAAGIATRVYLKIDSESNETSLILNRGWVSMVEGGPNGEMEGGDRGGGPKCEFNVS